MTKDEHELLRHSLRVIRYWNTRWRQPSNDNPGFQSLRIDVPDGVFESMDAIRFQALAIEAWPKHEDEW
jgi:hypothetical protein